MEKVILVAINVNNQPYFEEMIEECKALCDAADFRVVGVLSQASKKLDPNTGIRKGKIEEVKSMLQYHNCETVVFYNNLTNSMISNLYERLEVDVMDRTSLILNIFSKRARSKEAQIQTEMASLKYEQKRIRKENAFSDKQRGGAFNNRGSGESQSETLKRQIESRLSDLRRELKEIETRKDKEYASRNKGGIKKVALVGYTNAGKSSLMNYLLRSNSKEEKSVYEMDQLFATLDTSARNIKYKNYEFILFDTVGFVSDLPHGLIDAFKSTLKAATNADLLLHVTDSSSKNRDLHKIVTMDTLKEIGADDIPMIEVYNKADLLENKEETGGIYVSAWTGEGIEELLEKIVSMLYPKNEEKEILIPYKRLGVLNEYSSLMDYELVENNEEGSLYRIRTDNKTINEIIHKLRT
ncbi:MAG: GTPase HflX [Erysipelotrichaceae bacterium]|nr:GTPase HflX [Erysipelotrichaceae bacterium]